MDGLSALLGQAVQFVNTCWDRVVLNGSLEFAQRTDGEAGARRIEEAGVPSDPDRLRHMLQGAAAVRST
jgi:hypothetical protein